MTDAVSEPLLLLGDCLDRLREMDDCSVDSVVTDPPYGLSFMGKKWDYDVPSEEVWRECLRVLKPGGHLLAFAGTRTQHRMAVRIEDAGFEIRDMIAWVYSTGFPKSHNFGCKCSKDTLPYSHEENLPREPKAERDLHPLRDSNVSPSLHIGEGRGKVLQPRLSKSSTPIEGREQLSATEVWSGESSMEGRCNLLEEEGQLQANQVCQVSKGVLTDGEERRIHHGTPFNNGEDIETLFIEDRSRTSCKPQPAGQPTGKSGVIPKQRGAQEGGVETDQVCAKCGKLAEWQGWGTALKPALEPVTVARKPLGEKTVAANVLKHGTGAMNVDGCRVGTDESLGRPLSARPEASSVNAYNWSTRPNPQAGQFLDNTGGLGRWPANLIHDGSDEVVGLFPSGAKPKPERQGKKGGSGFGLFNDEKTAKTLGVWPADAGGSAARFFYCAKASKADRDEGCGELEKKNNMRVNGPRESEEEKHATKLGNHHPTVKPTALMRYLCRLVTPPEGIVLDPFMGSGSTGKAAVLEGFQFIGIERDEEYMKIAESRIAAAVKSAIAESA